jgi:hypothetical protein
MLSGAGRQTIDVRGHDAPIDVFVANANGSGTVAA